MEFSLFHRPTTTDIVMPIDLSHRHRYAAVRDLFSRMNQCHVNSGEKTKESLIMQAILHNSRYHISNITTLENKPTCQK
jgi:hypothetical protein